MPLYTRHNEMPSLASQPGKMNALYYNHVQTALKKLNNQIRLTIPTLKHLDLIVQNDAWIVIDRVLNDMPVVAWTEFQTEHRETLHEPIECEIRFFHYAASIILNKTLEAMELMLGEVLEEELPEDKSDILPFKKD